MKIALDLQTQNHYHSRV